LFFKLLKNERKLLFLNGTAVAAHEGQQVIGATELKAENQLTSLMN
jgi:hypothetical protein